MKNFQREFGVAIAVAIAMGVLLIGVQSSSAFGGGISNPTSGSSETASTTLLSDNNTFSGNNTFTKALILSGITGTTTVASGQGFTIGTSQFVVQQGSGNVGIGTTAPSDKLVVNGKESLANGILNGLFFQNNSTGADDASIAEGATLNIIAGSSNTIGFDSAGNASTIMSLMSGGNAYINTGGNVGIGTTSPQHGLSVQTDIQTYGAKADFGTGGNTAIVCYLSDGTLGHITITSVLASGNCVAN